MESPAKRMESPSKEYLKKFIEESEESADQE